MVAKSTPDEIILSTSSPVLILPATVRRTSFLFNSVKCCKRVVPLCSSSTGSLNEFHKEISKKSIFPSSINF